MYSQEIGLYIHIPFCASKCYYCDFNSYAGRDKSIEQYFSSMKRELEYYGQRLKQCRIKTVFIGGGTPSICQPQYIKDILFASEEYFNFCRDAEVTIETNPGTLSGEKLESYKELGVNRLSIGLQAWQDRLLRKLGRIHTVQEFLDNYRLARNAGFHNINIDLIFGLPEQSLKDWEDTLENIIKLNAEHISCYSLKIEENTVLHELLARGDILPVDDELDREMYHCAVNKLKENGYLHYELSNFAKEGYECRHNLVYWNDEQYLGVGAGAHSYLNDVRFSNITDIDSYIECISKGKPPVIDEYRIGLEESISEFMILGLRLTKGVNAEEFALRFGVGLYEKFGHSIRKLEERELIQKEGNWIRLTDTGLDLANQVFIEFI